ncbi:MAG: sigma-54-dependent Fis family transcriptional regulator [Syntrophobacteraceae bacterium]|nr:sigma-54-dependent Fis family transcriptional regulator [Syntrophobacteraceae bacterium]
MNPIQLLVVDDEESIRRLLQRELGGPRRVVRCADSARKAFDLIRRHSFDVVLLDVRLPDADGLDLLERFRESVPDAEVILVTGQGNIDSAVEAMKRGAYDYITKPFDLDRLELVVEKAFQRVCLQRENRLLRHAQRNAPPSHLIGNSKVVQQIHYLIDKVAPTNVPVLITGESGTGKDVVANAIHNRSVRAQQPFIVKNCGNLQKELVRSELFGYCKGAFTGATASQEGLLALAHMGTFFLDEIGELPLEVQASLLRVIEKQTFRRVGDQQERQVDVRFIFATNRNLAEEVKMGRFHEALFHRINVFHIDVLPLRERREDIPILVDFYLDLLCMGRPLCRVSREVMEYLMAYHWPGNVRELRNVLERGIILSENGWITPRALPKELREQKMEEREEPALASLEDVEKRHILKVLELVNHNRSQAAELLGIGRKTLYRKLKDYNVT